MAQPSSFFYDFRYMSRGCESISKVSDASLLYLGSRHPAPYSSCILQICRSILGSSIQSPDNICDRLTALQPMMEGCKSALNNLHYLAFYSKEHVPFKIGQ